MEIETDREMMNLSFSCKLNILEVCQNSEVPSRG